MRRLQQLFTVRGIVLLLVALLPAIFLGVYLLLNTINVPFYDQWEFEPIIRHLREGNFYWSDFWHQHNEHRILFPRIILIAAALITHWNTRVECFIDFGIALGSFTLLYVTLRDKIKQASLGAAALLLLLLSLVWFSPLQSDNWLWGWQIEWFLNVLGTVMIIHGFTRIKNKNISIADFSLMITGGLLAQYSLGNGTLLWPLLIAGILYLRLPRLKVLIATAVGVISTGLYYLHYVTPPDSTPKSVILHQPFHYADYVLIYLGRPLSFIHKVTPVLGLAVLCTFLLITVYLFVKHRDRFNTSIPWIFLGLYAIGSALITGASRLGLGISQAYSGRYATISSLLLVSIIVLCFMHRDLLRQVKLPGLRPLVVLAPLVICAFVLWNAQDGYSAGISHKAYMVDIQHCTHLEQPPNVCLLSTYPDVATVTPRLNYLKQIHWAGY